jgi:hypothetical protein
MLMSTMPLERGAQASFPLDKKITQVKLSIINSEE